MSLFFAVLTLFFSAPLHRWLPSAAPLPEEAE